ncbi:MAG: YciI family protein [Candidatus Eiseniibacteriota bacterium]
MRFMILHKTNAHWETGAPPSRELVQRVGRMIGELVKADVLEGAEGLRATSEGARVRFAPGGAEASVTRGPFEGERELLAGFTIVRAPSLEDAVDWAKAARQESQREGEAEIDIRPVTEPWDIGMGSRPAGMTTRRYMVLRKATAASEAGESLPDFERPAGGGVTHLASERMRPSSRGRRYKNSRDGVSVTDGPFAESKEMIGGYVVVSVPSLEDADQWARLYLDAVEADEVEVRELE